MVYIRKFSTVGSEMILLNTLQGHFGEVVSVCWNPVKNVWVTGSDDATIRVWVSNLALPLTSTWPHLNSDVGLEEGEY